MTFRCYTPKDFRDKDLELIGWANEIIESFAAKGFDMTVRQIHYQLVSRPDYANTQSNYDRLGRVLSEGREAGLVSWTAIADRGRGMRSLSYNKAPEEVFKGLDTGYRRDKWQDQEWAPFVGVEKQAMEGVLSGICYDLEVPFIAFKGYSSASTSWRLGQKFARAIQEGRRPILFYLGDHDPSGLDMIRDHQRRLSLFAGTQVIVQPLALTMAQIKKYDPWPNPLKRIGGKLSDSRGQAYEEEHGDESYELDALDPEVIQEVISDAVLKIRDEDAWEKSLAREVQDKEYIKDLVGQLGFDTTEEEEDDDGA